MKKDEFRNVIQQFILPLFTGSELDGEEVSSTRDAEVAQGVGGTILCKPKKSDDYRLVIKREQPFKKFEIHLVRAVLEELMNVYKYQIEELAYTKSLQQYALEKAICKSVSNKNYETLLDLIYELSQWSNRTYEGRRPSFGFVISPRRHLEKEYTTHFSDILAEDFSALVSDGINTCMFLNGRGQLLGYLNLPKAVNNECHAPVNLTGMAKACKNGRIGVSLLSDGDLLIFNEQELVFAKRGGEWKSFSHEEIINKMTERDSDEQYSLKEAVYLSALDVAFNKDGGCLAVVKKDQVESALKHLAVKDILLEEYYNKKVEHLYNFVEILEEDKAVERPKPYEEVLKEDRYIKTATLRKLINGRKFQELDRMFRAELLGIDGATIIDKEGNIIAVGAIVQIDAGSTGGGRLAATKTLAKYGTALKISMDGSIQCFNYDNKKQKVRAIFSI